MSVNILSVMASLYVIVQYLSWEECVSRRLECYGLYAMKHLNAGRDSCQSAHQWE